MSEKHLTKRSVKAGSWLLGHNALARLAGVVKVGVIARILTPEEFGVFGVAALALALLETFSETGIEQVLIQKNEVDEEDIVTAWWISLVRGLLIGLLLYLAAPLVGLFFKRPEAILFVKVIALAPVIRNLRNPGMVFFRRKLDFGKDFSMRTAGTLAELVVGVSVALITRSVWGLVASVIAGAVSETVISFVIAKPFKLTWPRWDRAKEMLSFGGWLWLSSIVNYLMTQGDDIVVGRLLGATNLGYYQNAYKIASLPATQVSGAVSQVTYPAYSSIQADRKRLARAFKKAFGATLISTLLLSGLIILLAEPLTRIILGDKWLAIVPILKILGIYGGIRSMLSTVGPVFKAVGKPQLITYFGMFRLLVLGTLIVPVTKQFGMVGTSWVVVFTALVQVPWVVWELKKIFRSS